MPFNMEHPNSLLWATDAAVVLFLVLAYRRLLGRQFARFAHWYEHKARWNKLRKLGTSQMVRVTIIAPVVASVLILTSKFLDFFASWRLLVFFGGSVATGAASMIYSVRCPGQCQKYDTAVEFSLTEADFFVANPKVLRRQITEHLAEWDTRHNGYVDRPEIRRRLSRMLRPSAAPKKPDVVFLMDQLWNMLDPSRKWSRWACLGLFSLGLGLLSIPPLVSLWQITLRFVREAQAL